MLAIRQGGRARLSAEFIGFCGNSLKNTAKLIRNAVFGIQKHRTSRAQTSVLSMQNLRTFMQRSPMFPVFRQEMAQKSSCPDFAIFQCGARRGGFRGHSQPVNDVVRERMDI